MDEFYLFGVEIETVSTGAVEDVALDGTPETVGMSTVDAELVGATGLGIELHAVVVGENIMGDGGLAHAIVDHLTGSIEWIARKGKGDGASGVC